MSTCTIWLMKQVLRLNGGNFVQDPWNFLQIGGKM